MVDGRLCGNARSRVYFGRSALCNALKNSIVQRTDDKPLRRRGKSCLHEPLGIDRRRTHRKAVHAARTAPVRVLRSQSNARRGDHFAKRFSAPFGTVPFSLGDSRTLSAHRAAAYQKRNSALYSVLIAFSPETAQLITSATNRGVTLLGSSNGII